MARFRSSTTLSLVTNLSDEGRACAQASMESEWEFPEILKEQWTSLYRQCVDRSGHLRLARMVHRLANVDCGIRESARAELELAARLIKGGGTITFLPEAHCRTADLEWRLVDERCVVEITAMVGSCKRQLLPLRVLDTNVDDEGASYQARVLTHRVLARIRQKSKQLSGYFAPVILSISIPRADLHGDRSRRRELVRLNMKDLAGCVTLLLTTLRQLSAVTITLWDVEPLPATSTARLANVEMVERSGRQRALPRVQLLVSNPDPVFPLSKHQQVVLKSIL